MCLLNCGSICLIQAYYSGTQTGAPVLSDTGHLTFLLFPMYEGHRGHQTTEEHPGKSDDKKKRWGDGTKFMLRTGVSAGTSTRELWSQSYLPSISEKPAHRLGVSLSTFQLFSGSCGLMNVFLPGWTPTLISSPSYSTMQLDSSPLPHTHGG